MKTYWMILPIGLVMASCEPIERGPVEDNKPVAGGVLRAGQFARTAKDNTSFFRQLPLSAGQADLLLQRHTSVRVIQVDTGYSKVELDNGEVGYVLTAMLEGYPLREPADPVGHKGPDISPHVQDHTPPTGTGIPDILPPTIDPE